MSLLTMKEITDETGLTGDTLRYYEKDGLLSDISRLPNGHRRYSIQDLEWLKFVICLRSTGMPLKTIKKYKDLMNLGDRSVCQRKDLLRNQRDAIIKEMETLKSALDTIDFKIGYYQSIEEKI